MKTIIKKIFSKEKFVATDINIGTLYKLTTEPQKHKYWLVKELDNLSDIYLQSDWFTRCIAENNDIQLPKNISLLVLHKVSDDKNLIELKKETLDIEEDPYHFKKYVLYYKESEVTSLIEQCESQDIYKFIKTELIKEDCFSEYKKDSKGFFWQSLIYRVANKVPFLEINIKSSKSLDSLFDSNANVVESKKLTDFDKKIFDALEEKTVQDINSFNELDLLKLLTPKVEVDGDKN